MNEFVKPYEYEEENGVSGLIMVFYVMLNLDVFFGISISFLIQNALASSHFLNIIFIVFSAFYLGLIIFSSIALFKIRKHVVKIINSLFVYRICYYIPSIIIIFISKLHDPKTFDRETDQFFYSVGDLVLRLLITPLLYTLLFSVLWHLYFRFSKRVKRTFGEFTSLE